MSEPIIVPASITAYLRALLAAGCVAAVERVRDAEHWTRGAMLRGNGARCLVGHAVDCQRIDGLPPRFFRDGDATARGPESWAWALTAWDSFAAQIGTRHAAQAVRAEAARLLEERA